MLKGSYALFMKMVRDMRIEVGSLGRIDFPRGQYIYIGSAMNGIEGRVKRHLRRSKKIYWHIDYFLRKADIEQVYILESEKKLECQIARNLADRFGVIKDFGSSDCNCSGHLFYGGKTKLENHLRKCGFDEIRL